MQIFAYEGTMYVNRRLFFFRLSMSPDDSGQDATVGKAAFYGAPFFSEGPTTFDEYPPLICSHSSVEHVESYFQVAYRLANSRFALPKVPLRPLSRSTLHLSKSCLKN